MSINFSKPQILECPSCGATLALPDADTFQCDYCGKQILVPPELRPYQTGSNSAGDTTQQNTPDWQLTSMARADNSASLTQRRRAVLFLAIGGMIVLIIIMISLLLAIPASSSTDTYDTSLNTSGITHLPTTVQFARLELVFGCEEDQPSQFDNTRSIMVDGQGDIFVADYTTGRINKLVPDASSRSTFGEQGEHAGQFDLSTGMIAITELDYLVIPDVYKVILFDNIGNYHNGTFTINDEIAEGLMFSKAMDSRGGFYNSRC